MPLSDPTNLRIPGPTPIPPEVIAAMSQPVIPHRGEEFSTLFLELLDQLKRLHGTQDDVFVVAGTGSVGWEAAIVNTLAPGDTVIAGVNGNFGERFVQVAERFGMNVVRVDAEWGKPVEAAAIASALADHPEARAVQVVHNETSTGVLNPMAEIGSVVQDSPAILIVDAVSGAAGAPINMADWPADIVFSGSQKAFMCPPGLSIIGVSEKVWPLTESAPIPRFIFDFKRMRDSAAIGSTPSTAPVNLIFGLKAACDLIEKEGLEQLYARHQRLAQQVRDGVVQMGLRLLAEPDFASPTVTVALMPDGVSAGDVQQKMIADHGIYIATGQADYRDRAIRIGHMGWTESPELERCLAALNDVLERIPALSRA